MMYIFLYKIILSQSNTVPRFADGGLSDTIYEV